MLPLLLSLLLAPPGDQPDVETTAQSRRLVEQLVAGEHQKVAEAFDETMRKALPVEKVGQVWQATTAPFGKWQGIERTRVEKQGEYEIVIVTCAFADGKLDSKFVFSSEGKVAGWFLLPASKYQTPAYVDTKKFAATPVEVGQGEFLLTLPGTLALPQGADPFPAIILVHGSGPQDRDETIGPNKPFRDLAQGLASRGIAVLRYEKRTKQHPLAMSLVPKLTVKEETIDDAVAAFDLLAKQPKIDPQRIYVLGHSLGGMLLPRLAERQPKFAGFISLAGSTRPLEDHILEQTKYILALDGLNAEDEQAIKALEQQVALVKSDKLTLQTPAKDLPLGSVPAAYWLDLRDYRPAEAAQQIKQPLLILQGERDYQVTMADFAAWKAALKGHDNVTFRSYPQLNHLFISGKGPSRPIEYLQAGNVAEEVIQQIAKWLTEAR